MLMTGGEAVVRSLVAHGVDTVFGIPGTHNLAIYDGLIGADIPAMIVGEIKSSIVSVLPIQSLRASKFFTSSVITIFSRLRFTLP